MEEESSQDHPVAMDKAATVILDIDSLAQSLDICSGSPKMTKALSRKGSSRIERRNGEELDGDDMPKKLVTKVANSQLEPLKQPLISTKSLVASPANGSGLSDSCEGRGKKLGGLFTIHPRKVLLIFATLSSMGTLILIYFTLAINKTAGA